MKTLELKSKKLKRLKSRRKIVQDYYSTLTVNNYIEEPVDVLTFLSDPHYLGNATRNGKDIFETWKKALVEMFRRQDKYIIVLTGSTGTGKTESPETPVLMYSGEIRQFKDIRVNDLVMGDDSTPRKVLEVHTVRAKAYEITPVKGDKFIVKHDHILSLKKTQERKKDKSAGTLVNISVDDYLKKNDRFKHCYKLWRVGVVFPGKEVPLAPYILGVWLGDGHNNPQQVQITNMDKSVIDEIYSFAEDNGYRVSTTKKKGTDCLRYNLCGNSTFSNILKKFNLIKNKHIPLIYKANSIHVRREILAGLVDSDGHIDLRCNSVEYSSKSKVLVEDTAYLARSLGYGAYVKKRNTRCQTGVFESYQLIISGMGSEMPFRKTKLPDRKQKKSVLITGIKSIKCVGEKDLVGFGVDRNHLFLHGDFTISHNSTVAIYALAYIQYQLMNLVNPWGAFGLGDSGKMSMSFFNLNKTLGHSRGYAKLQAYMTKSPWFYEHSIRQTKTKYGTHYEYALIKYLLSSPYSHGMGIVGEDVVAGILDEVDSPLEGIKQKERVIETYNATEVRFKNRFASKGSSYGKLFIVSSKQDELSFLDTFIAERKNFPEVLIFDIPVWEAKPSHFFCGTKFPVMIGDTFNPPRLIEEDERLNFMKKGFDIIDVPVEFKTEFRVDLIRALRDLAGVTVAGMRKYKLFGSETAIIKCFDPEKQNPIEMPTIMIGLNDVEDLIMYMDFSKIRMPKNILRCIHVDISFAHDATGIAMSGIKEWKEMDVMNADGTFRRERVPVVETDFAMRVKARDGERIPIHKIRKLVLDLRAAGFQIQKFTSDLKLLSEDTQQLLIAAGIPAEDFSLDKKPQAYFDFRNLVYEGRWVCHRQQMLLLELKNLEQSPLDKKIDHPDKFLDIEFLDEGGIKETVMEGSKDIADAVAGSVVNCIYGVAIPINTQLMGNLLQRTSTAPGSPEETISHLTKTLDGVEILGTKQGRTINKVNDIFKRLHGNR